MLYFGVLKDLVGHGRSEMELAEGASVAELLEVHRGLAKGQESLWDSIAVAVNQEYARAGDVLKDGDEVALLPPVSGGSLVLAGLGQESIPQGLKPLNSAGGRGPRLKPWRT